MEKVIYEKRQGIAYITLNRPEKKNAIDREMVTILDPLWEEFNRDNEVRVGIVTGAGGNFCSGFDIKAINSRQDQGTPYTWNRSAMFGDQKVGPDGHGVTKPIIGALDGHVNGAGVWLAMQTDIRIATTRTQFGLGEAKFNFPVEFTAFICDHIPRAIAAEMLFALKTFSGQRFFELGIINEIVSPEKLITRAEEIANQLMQKGPLGLMAMKALLNFDPNRTNRLEISAERVVAVANSEDTKEAVKALVEKRKPEWKMK